MQPEVSVATVLLRSIDLESEAACTRLVKSFQRSVLGATFGPRDGDWSEHSDVESAKFIVALLDRLLQSNDPFFQMTVFQFLLENASKNAVDGLIDLLQDKSPKVRARSAMVLGRLGTEGRDAAPGLKSLLSDQNWPVRVTAAGALVSMGCQDAECKSVLSASLQHDDEWVRPLLLGVSDIGLVKEPGPSGLW
jgi:hypothetical protein